MEPRHCEGSEETHHNSSSRAWWVAHTFNTSVRETEASGSLQNWGQSGLHNEFLASQGYIVSKETKQPHIVGQCLGVKPS